MVCVRPFARQTPVSLLAFAVAVASIPVTKDTSPQSPEGPPLEPLGVRLRRAPVTAALLAVCILLYLVAFAVTLARAPEPLATALQSLWRLSLPDPAGGTEVFRDLGALELTRVWLDGEWWRVLTTGLLHGSLLHLVLNCIALLSVGEWVERAWGHFRTFALFTMASIGGVLASLAWCESPMVLGASAGVLGEAAALWLARRWGPVHIRSVLAPISATTLGFLLLLCLGIGLVIPGIAQAGHLGGFAVGLLLGGSWVVSQRPVRVALLGTLALALVTLAWAGKRPTFRTNYHEFLGLRLLAEDNPAGALNLFKGALEREPDNLNLRNTVAYQLALANTELAHAEALVLSALEPNFLNASYLDTLGWIWCRQGYAESGLRVLHAAAWLSARRDPEIDEHLATCAEVSALAGSAASSEAQ